MSLPPRGKEVGRLMPIALLIACAAPLPSGRQTGTTKPVPTQPIERWPEATYSPQPTETETGFAGELARTCGTGDSALEFAALELARQLAELEPAPDPSRITQWLRRAGSPYVWPRAWALRGSPLARAETRRRIEDWLASFGDGGERRCGVVVLPVSAESELVSVVAVDTLADLDPLDLRVRVASWVEVGAELLVASAGSRLVVQGPRGLPWNVPISEARSRVRGRFNADQHGVWHIQLLATVAGGPRPVLEAIVFAGEEPSESEARPAPGEEAADPTDDPRAALERMIQSARRHEGLSALGRDERLDHLAQQHAERMRAHRRVLHDAGQGDAVSRLELAGIAAAAAGENLARARSARAAHRTLWSSPSHRANLLSAQFNALGVGVAVDHDQSLWVCELFAQVSW